MRLYREFAGEYDAGAGPESPKAAGPTFVKIEDPMVPVDQVVELLDEGTKYGRIANAWLRRKGNRRLARDAETGAMALEGRVCCMELARRVDRELARITPPKDFRCDVCGALWRVEVRVREDRRARVW
jgi:hypothetical protein